ncbi:MAG: hypothetical protein OXK80_05905 [Bdellovibrionales bacterium]|nr:hypothetical protein [Bdellovibrionales bacterium]
MKLLIIILILCSLNFVFSNQKTDGKNLLENNLLKKSQPTQDLLEVVEELENTERSVASEEQGSLQLKDTPSVDVRKLAQMPKSASEPKESEPAESEAEEIGQGVMTNDGNLKSLIHESVFQREHARRDLDVYVEDQEGLSLSDVEVQEDLGSVEVRWKPPEELD